MNRILVTGINGQVGRELQRALVGGDEILGIGRETLDLSQSDQVRQAARDAQPNIIINAAAYTAVDKAETEPELAKAVNATAPTVLAEVAQELGATLIQISTDYVFDGNHSTPYEEDAPPAPTSVYGWTKLGGELGIQQATDQYLILRTAWVYGTYGKSNFVKTMLRLGAERPELRVVADQIGSPTWARDIATTIAQLVCQLPTVPWGTYHLTNSGVASWYDFAVAIFEEARSVGFPLAVQRVVPITTLDYPTPAKRPAYSVLSGRKLATILGEPAPHWRQQLRHMLVELYHSTYESNHSERR